jgi:SAM-dependent methyltransferase
VIERTKYFVKTVLPGGARIYQRFRSIGQTLTRRDAGKIFTDIYRNKGWADSESVSGRGSTLARTRVVREALPALLKGVGARSLFDAACGDFNWMRHVELEGLEYVGADVVPELVERNRELYGSADRTFVVLDITRDRIPKADAILCRDCFIHLSFKHARAAIANFKMSGARFLLATTHTSVLLNSDIKTGDWRSINLQLPPFDFPPPSHLIVEDEELGKCLGVWRLEELCANGSARTPSRCARL